jgi:two-component system response regulator FixJ
LRDIAVVNSEHRDATARGGTSPQASPNASEPTIYIVDPDEPVRESLERLLRLQQFSVRSFSSAEAFLESYNGSKAACLIVEFDLPGLSGLGLLESLSRREIDLPAIVLSGQGNVSNAVRALRAGAIDFVEKPFVPHVLVRQAREAIRQARRSSVTRRDTETPS